jgi:hypothetical protein
LQATTKLVAKFGYGHSRSCGVRNMAKNKNVFGIETDRRMIMKLGMGAYNYRNYVSS